MTTGADSHQPEDQNKAANASAATSFPLRNERELFSALLLGNPNYFGTVKGSNFMPVLPLQENTSFEQLECIGFNPQLNLLEGIVWIKQNSGYGGDICSAGTQEYVSFFVDWNNDGNWVCQGTTSFTAYDITSEKPLEYAVSLSINPPLTWCFLDNLPNVRAILSWNSSPGCDPNFIPVFGNVVEARIQIEALQFIILSGLLEAAKVELPEEFATAVDLSQPISTAKPQALSLVERAAVYQDQAVPPHRFAFVELQQAIANPALNTSLGAGLGLDLAPVIGKLLVTGGDTTYEELTCIGLNPNQSALEGTIKVKLPSGYSGSPCTAGSYEYVTFWIDYGDGNGCTFAGLTTVNVHDFAAIPADGLQYAVFLPVNFSQVQQPCQNGPKVVRVLATLSWNVPVLNCNQVPVWGNQLETLILVTPGSATTGNVPYIDSVGNMGVCDIDQTTGLATGIGIIAGFTALQSPFGGQITISGFITNPPNWLAGATPLKYRISVREFGGTWQPLANTFQIDYTEQNGLLSSPFQVTGYYQSIDTSGFYTYLEQVYPSQGQWLYVTDHVLARWNTSNSMTGLWEIKIEAKLPDGTIVPAGFLFCPKDGTYRSSVVVDLDQNAPSASVAITSYSRNGGPTQPAGDCGTFEVGDILYGTYSTFDPESHFGSFSLNVLPSGNAINPPGGSYPSVSTNGQAGTWSLDTQGMQPCGYVIELNASDRTIVNSGSIGWWNPASTGFCLNPVPTPPPVP